MVLGGLLGAGVPLGVIADAVDKVAPGEVALAQETVVRGGLSAVRCHVEVADTQESRTWRDVERLLAGAGLHEDVRSLAHDVFERLAEAEGRVHGVEPAEVHFHEVGALDALADVVGACAGFVHLGAARVVVSPVAVGAGSVAAAHGRLPVPVPAVVELLRGVPSYGGSAAADAGELCTPTGAALLATLADDWGAQPAMLVEEVGVGAGARDPEGHPNVLRLLVGRPFEDGAADAAAPPGPGTAVLLETNVDDLDPRLWPGVLAELIAAGAGDAWLTPILMKKGRPAHTLSVLVAPELVGHVRSLVFRHTSTLGLREQVVGKHALERRMAAVDVDGCPVAVKVAVLEGQVVNAQPEFDDVAAAARTLGRPVKDVMAQAAALARELA
jgi:pyridinium-3,5-bisthiocarboxylic acid mononucleotide nickel chelatase